MNSVESYQKQHFDNYKMALCEIIKNNTDMLIEEDIMPLFLTPPVDSMDVLKRKIITIAKTEDNVVDINALNEMIDCFRAMAKKVFEEVSSKRLKFLTKQINEISIQDRTFHINKQKLTKLTKELSLYYEKKISHYIENNMIPKIDSLLSKEEKDAIFFMEVKHFLDDFYPHQLFQLIDSKFYHKNTTLMNGLNEQKKRYLFTKKNSYLYK